MIHYFLTHMRYGSIPVVFETISVAEVRVIVKGLKNNEGWKLKRSRKNV